MLPHKEGSTKFSALCQTGNAFGDQKEVVKCRHCSRPFLRKSHLVNHLICLSADQLIDLLVNVSRLVFGPNSVANRINLVDLFEDLDMF